MVAAVPPMICPRCWKKNPSCIKCEGTGQVADLRLSKNFLLSEMLASPTAVAQNVSNDANTIQIGRLAEACVHFFQAVRDGLGPLKVTSGFRSPALNTAIGGSKNSAHMYGYALDSQPQKVSLEAAMKWLHHSPLKFDQAILELGKHKEQTNDDWLHLGWKHPATLAQRRQFLIMENGTYRPWSP